nr:phosphotransferase [Spelaeicoccus albus]
MTAPGLIARLGAEHGGNFLLHDETGARYVLKSAETEAGRVAAALESAALMRLADADPSLPVPRIVRTPAGAIDCSADDGLSARVITCLPGAPLPSRPARLTLGGLGDVLARIDLAFAGWGKAIPERNLEWDLRSVPRIDRLLGALPDPPLARRAVQRYEACAAALDALACQPIHNDANPSNVLVADDGGIAGIIDFGDIVSAPAVQDVATACAYQVRDDDDPLHDVAMLAAAYHARRPLSDAEIALLPPLMAARNVLCVAVGAANATRDPANSAYLLRNSERAWANLCVLDSIDPDDAVGYLLAAVRGPIREDAAHERKAATDGRQ